MGVAVATQPVWIGGGGNGSAERVPGAVVSRPTNQGRTLPPPRDRERPPPPPEDGGPRALSLGSTQGLSGRFRRPLFRLCRRRLGGRRHLRPRCHKKGVCQERQRGVPIPTVPAPHLVLVQS